MWLIGQQSWIDELIAHLISNPILRTSKSIHHILSYPWYKGSISCLRCGYNFKLSKVTPELITFSGTLVLSHAKIILWFFEDFTHCILIIITPPSNSSRTTLHPISTQTLSPFFKKKEKKHHPRAFKELLIYFGCVAIDGSDINLRGTMSLTKPILPLQEATSHQYFLIIIKSIATKDTGMYWAFCLFACSKKCLCIWIILPCKNQGFIITIIFHQSVSVYAVVLR